MSRFVLRKHVSFLVLGISAMALTGCVGGTTYGTGVSQEEQLLQDLEGMISMGSKKKKQTRINYSARPDLIIPSQTTALPAPVDQGVSTSNADWPESPEQRLARIRGDAEQADVRSGEISLEEQRRNKIGIKVGRGKFNNPDIDRDGHAAIDALKDGSYKNAAMLRKLNSTSTGGPPSRKYLTEPPVEYRIPASSAPTGDLGISEAEKERRAEKAAKRKKANDTGMWSDN